MKLFAFIILVLFFAACTQNPNTGSKSNPKHLSFSDSVRIHKEDSAHIRMKRIVDSLNFIKIHKDASEAYDRMQAENIAWNKSKAGKIQKNNPEWTREDCSRIADNKIWIGMSIDMVIAERGRYNHRNVSNYGNGNEYQYCWTSYDISCFYDTDGDGLVDSYN